MFDLFDVKRRTIIRVRLAGASMFRTDNPVGVSWTPVSRFITAYINLGKVFSVKHNKGRKPKLKDHDRQVSKRIVPRKRKSTLPQITSEMNTHFQNPLSMKNIQWDMHAVNTHDRVAIPKPLVSARNVMQRLECCLYHLNWTQLQCGQVIWSGEFLFTLFHTT
ncbi:transposable element Tc1 transposase [Trichonephila clavipes]|uniref:Transposable element Tc1 transposase n=1 Tax=Trichonephila clavipes TaxID=2585209 RepID=A0A8X6R6C7_TRICX|nr:transposable element Tc1 transposase [Trichonephila clavipes]